MKDNQQANFNKRIIAYFIDILLIFIVFNLISSIKVINPNSFKYEKIVKKYQEVLKKFNNKEITETEFIKKSETNLYYINKYSVSYNIILVCCLFLYFVIFQKFNNGQTIGKKLMKIKVIDKNGKNPSVSKYFLRILPMLYIGIGGFLPILLNLLAILIFSKKIFIMLNLPITYIFFIIFIVDIGFILIRKDKQTLHDLLAGTSVIFDICQ